jgi:hypothetical protein
MQPSTPPFKPEPDVLVSQPSERRPSRRGLVAGLLTVALLAAGATGVALAADGGTATPTPGSSGVPSAGPEGPRGLDGERGPGGMMGGHRGFGGPGLMGAVHGELVVPKDGGGYETMLVQRGKATAVSATSISVKSDDGFTATYAVNKNTVVHATSDGITSIAKNADVVVMARKTGSGGTALRVMDLSSLGSFHHDFDGDGRGPGSDGKATPTPSTTTGSSSTGV